jgi:site-specific recombinase XerD
MRLYSGTTKSLIEDSTYNRIATKLKDAFFLEFRYQPPVAEVNSWNNSLRAISQVFQTASLLDHGVLLELQLPLTSKRLDCLVTGYDSKKAPNAVIIELKQWSGCKGASGKNEVATFVGGGVRDVLHPSVQVGQYMTYLTDCHTAFQGEDGISAHACSYLHNYSPIEDDPLFLPQFAEQIRRSPVFTADHVPQLLLAKAKEPYRTWYGLAAETGLRAGELCGLTVDDIDLERGMLQVRQSSWRGKLGDPKTAESIRVVELSPQASRHLRTFLESWHPNERRLLFATRNGTPWDQNLLLKRKFKPLLRALGIRVPRGNGFHAFRHANATLMNSFGASQKLRQQRLGHADGSPVTDTIYTHVISEDGKRIAAQLGNAVWGILDASWTEKEIGSGVEPPKPFVIN